MPIYEYQCDSCGFQAEKLWSRISLAQDAIPCTECGTEMRKLVSVANHAFSHPASQTRGAAPPNTGTSDDWNFDKAIGKDAAEKWEKIEKRNQVKDKVIQEERREGKVVTKEQLVPSKDGPGSYRVITEPERVRANQNRETVQKVSQAAKTQASKKPKK